MHGAHIRGNVFTRRLATEESAGESLQFGLQALGLDLFLVGRDLREQQRTRWMRLLIAHGASDLPVMNADLGALVEVSIELVALRTQGEIFPHMLLDLRHARIVFVELGGNELAACALGRTVDPGNVRHGATIEPNASANGDVAIIWQLGGVDDVRRNEPPAIAFHPLPLPTDAELHRPRLIIVGLQVFVIRCQTSEHQILAIRVMTVRGGGFDFDLIPPRMRHAGIA